MSYREGHRPAGAKGRCRGVPTSASLGWPRGSRATSGAPAGGRWARRHLLPGAYDYTHVNSTQIRPRPLGFGVRASAGWATRRLAGLASSAKIMRTDPGRRNIALFGAAEPLGDRLSDIFDDHGFRSWHLRRPNPGKVRPRGGHRGRESHRENGAWPSGDETSSSPCSPSPATRLRRWRRLSRAGVRIS